jgi:hypothetical protein
MLLILGRTDDGVNRATEGRTKPTHYRPDKEFIDRTCDMGQTLPWAACGRTSGLTPIVDSNWPSPLVAEVPCVDGSLLARVFFTVQLVGCGHVFGLFARFT